MLQKTFARNLLEAKKKQQQQQAAMKLNILNEMKRHEISAERIRIRSQFCYYRHKKKSSTCKTFKDFVLPLNE